MSGLTWPVPEAELRRLWDEVEAEVLRFFRGKVSVAKFMHQPDEETAALRWMDRVREMLARVPDWSGFVGSGPDLNFSSRVRGTFDLAVFTISIDDREVWKTALRPGAAVLISDALAEERWGSRWVETIGTIPTQPGPVVLADDDKPLPWIAQFPSGPGPWTRAATEQDAHRAARVEALGIEVVAGVYERLAAAE